MVAYTDVPEVTALSQQLTQIDSAIAMLDGGGTVSQFTVAPAPPEQVPSGYPPPPSGPMMMAVQIATVIATEGMLKEVRAALVIRHNVLVAQLAALGVTASPPEI